jgi:hypothetical protein
MFKLILITFLLIGATALAAPPVGQSARILSPRRFPGWQSQNVCFPFILSDASAGGYRMFYSGSASEQWNASVAEQWVTGYVTSTDTTTWKYPENFEQVLFARKLYEGDVVDPVVMAAKFDSMYAIGACVILDGDVYKCWYTGWNGETEHAGNGITKKINFRIGYATSPNAIAWAKTPGSAGAGSVLGLGPAGSGENKGVAHPHVLKEGGTYRMWYEGYDGNLWKLFYATSSDGVNWTRISQALAPGGGLKDQLGLRNPMVIRRNNQYELWYQGQSSTSPNYHILRATSKDGNSWAKVSQEVVLHPTPALSGSESIHVDSAIVQDNQSVQLFYAKQTATTSKLTNGSNTIRNFEIYTEVVDP